ncbi:hypothetical protein D3C81_1704030 [compost metagenome]
MALVSRLTITRTITPPMLNSGSDSDPDTGRFTSITPLRSFSNDTASSTGSFTASGLSTRSPKVS